MSQHARVIAWAFCSLIPQLAVAGTLSGHVVDPAGSPISGVTVVAYDTRLNYGLATSRSDGPWEMTGIPAGYYRIRGAPSDDSGYVDRFYPDTWDYCTAERVLAVDGETTGGIDVVLPLGGTLTGRVVDEAGAPVDGARVVAQGLTARTSLGMRETVTGADGRFDVVGLDSDAGQPEPWRCFVDAPGHPYEYFGPTYIDDDATTFDVSIAEETDIGDQALLPGIRVSGTARGPDGPVTSGTAFVFSTSQAMAATVASDGTYIADGLPPGNVIAWVESPGLATTYYPDADRPGDSVPAPDEGQDVTGVDLQLPPESSFTAHFMGEGDLGEVSIMLYNSTYTVARGSPVGDDGSVTIGGLFPGTYALYVYGADGGFEEGLQADAAGEALPFVVDGATSFDLTLARAATIEGVVRDDAGAPVYGAYVSAIPTNGDPTRAVQTDAEGAYAVTGLLAGTYTLVAQYVAYCPLDPGYVQVWWADALVEETAGTFSVERGADYPGTDFVLPVDADHDGMGSAWEAENGLDPGRDDAAEDPDGDGLANLEEYHLGTDPTGAGAAADPACGCGGGKAGLLGLLGLAWGAGRRSRRGATRSAG